MTLLINRSSVDSALERKLLEKHKKLEKDFLWINANSKKIRAEYPNKYIAVKDQQVKYVAKSIDDLISSIHSSGQNPENYAVTYVDTKPKNLLL